MHIKEVKKMFDEGKKLQMIGWESGRWGLPGVMPADCQEGQDTDSRLS